MRSRNMTQIRRSIEKKCGYRNLAYTLDLDEHGMYEFLTNTSPRSYPDQWRRHYSFCIMIENRMRALLVAYERKSNYMTKFSKAISVHFTHPTNTAPFLCRYSSESVVLINPTWTNMHTILDARELVGALVKHPFRKVDLAVLYPSCCAQRGCCVTVSWQWRYTEDMPKTNYERPSPITLYVSAVCSWITTFLKGSEKVLPSRNTENDE